jgi:hypothetical protein
MRDYSISATQAGWLRGHPKYASTRELPLRTVFNAKTHQHEEIPLAQFQQLLRQGKIEETEGQSPYDGHPQRIYRLL